MLVYWCLRNLRNIDYFRFSKVIQFFYFLNSDLEFAHLLAVPLDIFMKYVSE